MTPKPRRSQAASTSGKARYPKTGQASVETASSTAGAPTLPSATASDGAEPRVFKDELNLIEYPWTALWKHEDATTVISHEWDVPHPMLPGKTVRALWRVAGDPELGLPSASDLRVYLVLMELTRDQGMPQIVTFTRYDLLKRLGWPDERKRYESLRLAFRRLTGVRISAQNAFRDGRTRALRDVEFSIIDNVEIIAARPGRKPKTAPTPAPQNTLELPMSFFRWNDVIYNSLQHGYLATLNLDFALSLRNDVALSLYRLLSKKTHGNRTRFEMELSEFYGRHLGLRPTRYHSKMKERLKGGHDELIERGFLHEVSYEPMKTRKGEKIVYVFPPSLAHLPLEELPPVMEAPVEAPGRPVVASLEPEATATRFGQQRALVEAPADIFREVEETALVERVAALGVAVPTARLLVEGTPREALELQLDCLAARGPKDAAATFVAAVRGGWKPPAAYLARREAEARTQNVQASKKRKATREREMAQEQAERQAQEREENAALDTRFETLPDAAHAEIEAEVGERLKFVVQHFSEATARGGWDATRRQVMREWDALGKLDAAQAEAAQSARMRLLLASDREVDALWDELDEPSRADVEQRVRQRVHEAGMTTLTPEKAAWQGVRRTIVREMARDNLLPLAASSGIA